MERLPAVEQVLVAEGVAAVRALACAAHESNELAKLLAGQHKGSGVSVASERSTVDDSSSSFDVAGTPSDVDNSVLGLDRQAAPAFQVLLGPCRVRRDDLWEPVPLRFLRIRQDLASEWW